METDPDRDIGGKRQHSGRAAPAPDSKEDEKGHKGHHDHHDVTLEGRGGLARKLQGVLDGIDEQEDEQADCQRKKER